MGTPSYIKANAFFFFLHLLSAEHYLSVTIQTVSQSTIQLAGYHDEILPCLCLVSKDLEDSVKLCKPWLLQVYLCSAKSCSVTTIRCFFFFYIGRKGINVLYIALAFSGLIRSKTKYDCQYVYKHSNIL